MNRPISRRKSGTSAAPTWALSTAFQRPRSRRELLRGLRSGAAKSTQGRGSPHGAGFLSVPGLLVPRPHCCPAAGQPPVPLKVGRLPGTGCSRVLLQRLQRPPLGHLSSVTSPQTCSLTHSLNERLLVARAWGHSAQQPPRRGQPARARAHRPPGCPAPLLLAPRRAPAGPLGCPGGAETVCLETAVTMTLSPIQTCWHQIPWLCFLNLQFGGDGGKRVGSNLCFCNLRC